MNFSYFRKSKFSKEQTVNNLKAEAIKLGFEISGELELKDLNGLLIHIHLGETTSKILKADKNVISLTPNSVAVIEAEGIVNVGTGVATILSGVSNNPEVHKLGAELDKKLKELVNQASGAGEQKVESVKLFSTTTCPYCVAEKQWLDKNNVAHEIVYVDSNREEAEYMVSKTGQMGVPVTEIMYEDGDAEYVVGFDRNQLGKLIKQ